MADDEPDPQPPQPPPHDAEGSAVEEPDEAVAPSTELAVVTPPNAGVIVAGDTPEAVLNTVGRIATSLKKFIKEQGLAANMGGGKEHVEIGAWQSLGHMLGTLGGTPVHPETAWTRPLCSGAGEIQRVDYVTTVLNRKSGETYTYEVRGIEAWEASVQVLTPDGTVVGRAEAMCSRFEQKWARRDDYAVRSMAETRAASRAFRAALGWIIHAAGYSVTPAEEMPPVVPEYAQAAAERAIGNMRLALAFILQEAEPGELTEGMIAELRKQLDNLGVPAEEIPRLVTITVVALGTFMVDALKAARESEHSGPRAVPDPAPAVDAGDSVDGQQQQPEIPMDDRELATPPRSAANPDDDIPF